MNFFVDYEIEKSFVRLCTVEHFLQIRCFENARELDRML